MLKTPLPQTWDLDTFFPGGSASPALAEFIARCEADVADLTRRLRETPPARSPADAGPVAELAALAQDLSGRIQEAGSQVNCLSAQNVRDEKATLLMGRIQQLRSAFDQALAELDRHLLAMPEAAFQALLADPRLAGAGFYLAERRALARRKLPPEQEALAGALAANGYHAWSVLYDAVVGRITIPWEEDGRETRLSVSQAYNKLRAADRAVRAKMQPRWDAAWSEAAELIAIALNQLAGFRINLYAQRGWDDVLEEPLALNRLQRTSLEAMWDAVERKKDVLVRFLRRKAELLGLPRLEWHDVDAPLSFGPVRTIPYDEAAAFIVEQLAAITPQQAEFSRRAFQERWLEVEDRPGKRPGGFCSYFPVSRQSRIFLTYSGTPWNVATVAHELGHAYHGWILHELPYFAQVIPMSVAETASNFAERAVTEAALARAQSREERLTLLAQSAQEAVTHFMNIHHRFLFETRFYAARRQGPLSVAELNALMVEAQREAFRDCLAGYDPLFWAWKGHFYDTEVPFYNFPYTVGYLFSAGIYARARAEGKAFEPKYIALLQDSGRMTTEELARKHLGEDLTRPEFWDSAVAEVLAGVEAFLRETEKGERETK